MKQKFENLIVKILGKSNRLLAQKTDKKQIISFLTRLYPLFTNWDLIRFGPDGDGGYLLPNDLVGIKACFSAGIGQESGFEKDCADFGIKVYLADNSVDGPAIKNERFFFTKKNIGIISNEDFITLDDWVSISMNDSNSELIMQMDIEGYEYEVFLSASHKLMGRFRIIIVEFHDLQNLWIKPYFEIIKRVFEKILHTHSCVHIHPNNSGFSQREGIIIPHLMEFTFLRNDRIKNSFYQTTFPHILDSDNTTNPKIILPDCWYKRDI